MEKNIRTQAEMTCVNWKLLNLCHPISIPAADSLGGQGAGSFGPTLLPELLVFLSPCQGLTEAQFLSLWAWSLTPSPSHILSSVLCSPECCFTWRLNLRRAYFILSLRLFPSIIFFFPFSFAALVKNIKFITPWSCGKHLSGAITHDMTVTYRSYSRTNAHRKGPISFHLYKLKWNRAVFESVP